MSLADIVGVGLGLALAALVALLALAWLVFHIRSRREEAAYQRRKTAKAAEIAQLNAQFHAPAHDKEARNG
ncbi:hypothetical protein [Micromonospora sp. DT47]|uniref:hypothetical protein n=1 Tax=Micromonospora sp. DT47 TaxID=3393431 RepID=UPI003CF1C6C0